MPACCALHQPCLACCLAAGILEKLEEREQELGIIPDPALAAYVTALQKAGRQNMITDLILKTLGLDICAETLVVSSAGLV